MVQLQFVVPGFSKCGTTTLCELLGHHPSIFIPESKEPGYFAENHRRGAEWYAQWFAKAQPGQLRGDGSTTYSSREFVEQACARLVENNPAMKFIFIARHPLRRLESSYREMHHSGYKYGIEAEFDMGRMLDTFPNMLADSRYWSLLDVFRERVSDDRILTVLLEDLQRNPAAELRRCFRFLEVDPDVEIMDLERQCNSGSEKYYDTRFLRRLKKNGWVSKALRALSQRRREKTFRQWGLRRRFTTAIQWAPETLARVQHELDDEATNFLDFCGRSPDCWEWPTSRHANLSTT